MCREVRGHNRCGAAEVQRLRGTSGASDPAKEVVLCKARLISFGISLCILLLTIAFIDFAINSVLYDGTRCTHKC
jgi:hypothetical protein